MRICATNSFSICEIGIIPHIGSQADRRVVDLGLMDLSLMLLSGLAIRRAGCLAHVLNNAAHQQHHPGKNELDFGLTLSGPNNAGSLY